MPKASKSIIVTVADHAMEDIHGVAGRLEKHGMSVTRVLPKTGVITGSVPSSKMQTLKGVDGVMSVEEELSAFPS